MVRLLENAIVSQKIESTRTPPGKTLPQVLIIILSLPRQKEVTHPSPGSLFKNLSPSRQWEEETVTAQQ